MRIPKFIAYSGAALAGMAGVQIMSRLLFRRRMDGEVTLITGASRGLGLAIAHECAQRGSHVAITARDADELQRAAAALRRHGVGVLPLVCDVRNKEQIHAAVGRTQSAFGRIDTLVNNAGIIAVGPMQTMTEADYRESMETHFWAVYYAVEAARPVMQSQGRGRIVNVTSIGGKVSVPHLLPYCAGKFAAVGYSEGLLAELASEHISVTTAVPGLMRTGSPRNAFFKSQHRKEYAWFMLSDTLPVLSIAASSAARAIVDAALARRAEVILSLPAQAAVLMHGIAPGFTSNVLSLVSRLLPQPGGIGDAKAAGSQSESGVTESPLTALGRKAEREYNQL